MRKPTILSLAIAGLLAAGLWGAPAFAEEAEPAAEEATTTDDGSTDAAPAEGEAGEEKPAE